MCLGFHAFGVTGSAVLIGFLEPGVRRVSPRPLHTFSCLLCNVHWVSDLRSFCARDAVDDARQRSQIGLLRRVFVQQICRNRSVGEIIFLWNVIDNLKKLYIWHIAYKTAKCLYFHGWSHRRRCSGLMWCSTLGCYSMCCLNPAHWRTTPVTHIYAQTPISHNTDQLAYSWHNSAKSKYAWGPVQFCNVNTYNYGINIDSTC